MHSCLHWALLVFVLEYLFHLSVHLFIRLSDLFISHLSKEKFSFLKVLCGRRIVWYDCGGSHRPVVLMMWVGLGACKNSSASHGSAQTRRLCPAAGAPGAPPSMPCARSPQLSMTRSNGKHAQHTASESCVLISYWHSCIQMKWSMTTWRTEKRAETARWSAGGAPVSSRAMKSRVTQSAGVGSPGPSCAAAIKSKYVPSVC